MAQAEHVINAIPRLITGASEYLSTNNPVCVAHAEFVAALMGHPPRPIPIDADTLDLEERANHLDQVLGALSSYVTLILDDAAQNVPGGLDLPHIEAVLTDLASDVAGAIQLAAEGLEGRVE
jgi:hypothetical protein